MKSAGNAARSAESLSPELAALEARFRAEDCADVHTERKRRRAGLPEPRRGITPFDGFASGGAAHRHRPTTLKVD